MKVILLAIVLSLAFAACNSNKKPGTENKTVAVKSMADTVVDEKEKRTVELKKAAQLTLEQLRALLPSELDSAKERNFLASTQFGYGLASVEYPKTRSRSIKVTLYDCAGELGSANYFENYWNYLNVNKETDHGFTRTIDLNGGKAIETYKKDMNLSTLTFTLRDRLVFVMEGKNIQPQELEAAAKKLHQK